MLKVRQWIKTAMIWIKKPNGNKKNVNYVELSGTIKIVIVQIKSNEEKFSFMI